MTNAKDSPAYAFPLSIQLNAPQDLFCTGFRKLLALLQAHGFYGVELNILDFEAFAPREYTDMLAEYGLRLTMIASGGYAKRLGLSLSSGDGLLREKTIEETKKMIAFAGQTRSGVILGYIKGPAGENPAAASARFSDSLSRLSRWAGAHEVPLLIEATNRYEASVAIALADAFGFVADLGSPWLRILPDTFHMNIEEADVCYSLLSCRQHFGSVHFSDNNRCFPGFGAIDFFKIMACLLGMGYQGGIAIEGNPRGSLEESISFSAEYLRSISQRLLLHARPEA